MRDFQSQTNRLYVLGLSYLASLSMMLGLSGCATTQEHRARQYSSTFGALPESAQKISLSGGVSIGMTPVEVYVALGAPLKMGKSMAMPGVSKRGSDWWFYIGGMSEETGRLRDEVIRFRSQFFSPTSLATIPEYLTIQFKDGSVYRIWHRSVDDEILGFWQ